MYIFPIIYYILILYFKISKCEKEFISKNCPFYDIESLFLYYSKGIIIGNNTDISFNNTFIYCVNGYFTKGYLEKELGDNFYNNSGIFIGSSVDLSDFNYSNISNITLQEKIKNNFYNVLGEKANNKSLLEMEFTNDEIIEINKIHYKEKLNEMKIYYNKNNFPTKGIELSILCYYVKFHKFKNETNRIQVLLSNNQYNDIAYYFLTIPGNYIQKKLLFLAMNSFNNNHKNDITILFDSLIDVKDIKNFKNFFKLFINLNPDNIFTLANSTNILGENMQSYDIIETLSNYQFQTDFDKENFTVLNDILNKKFNNDSYYKKNLIIFLNDKPDQLKLDIFYEKGINIILIGNWNRNFDINDMNSILNYQHNDSVLPFYSFNLLNKEFADLTNCLLNSQIENITIDISNNIFNINNILTRQNNSYQYFYIKLKNLKNTNDKFIHVKLIHHNINDILKYNTVNITFFISFNNPYSDIINTTYFNYGYNFNNTYININSSDLKDNSFYIGIFGNDLNYSISISSCIYNEDEDCIENSNGVYKKIGDISIDNITRNYFLFSQNCYRIECINNYTENDFYKLYVGGLSKNDDKRYIDFNLYNCLSRQIYCLYLKAKDPSYDKDSAIYISNETNLAEYDEFKLYYKNNIPIYLINRLYYFFPKFQKNKNYTEILDKYNVNFSINEINLFNSYNILSKYVALENYINCQNTFNSYTNSEKFAFHLYSIYNSTREKDEKIIICNKNNFDIFLEKTYNNSNDNINSKNIEYLLLKSENNIKYNPKYLISFLVGKNLLYYENFINFLNFYFSKSQLSISYFDNKENIVNFFEFNNLNTIKKFDEKNFVNISYIDLEKMLIKQYDLFQYYDDGFQKIIIIIYNSNKNNKYRYDIMPPSEKVLKKIYDLGIDIFFYSDKKLEYFKDDIKLFTFLNKIYIVNYKDFDNLQNEVDLLKKTIHNSVINLRNKKHIVLDISENEVISYSFDFNIKNKKPDPPSKLSEKFIDEKLLKFIIDDTNIIIYFSNNYTYPNKYNNIFQINPNSKELSSKEFEINKNKIIFYHKISNENNGKFYLTIEGKKNITYLNILIYECENKNNCKFEKINFFFKIFPFFGILIFLFGIYIIFSNSQNLRKNNIFDYL